MVPNYASGTIAYRLVTPEATVEAAPKFAELITTVGGEVAEPIDWRNVRRRIKRNKQTHGVKTGIDGTIQVIFDRAAGGDVIREVVDTFGPHVEVYLAMGTMQSTWQELERYRLKFTAGYREEKAVVKVTLETLPDFRAKMADHVNTDVNVFGQYALTGDYIGYPEEMPFTLHSRSIFEQYAMAYQAGQDESAGVLETESIFAYVQPGLSTITVEELEGVAPQIIGITETSPYANQDFLLETQGGGNFTFHIQISGEVTFDHTGLFIQWLGNSVTWRLISNLHNEILHTTNPGSYTKGEPIIVSFDETRTLQLEPGDQVYLYATLQFTADRAPGAKFQYSFLETAASVSIDAETAFPATVAEGQTVYSVAERIVAQITGQSGRVQSTLLGPGGCLANLRALPGFYLRGFHPLEKPFTLSWETLMKSLNALRCIGWTIVEGNDGPIVIIEDAEYFYQDVALCAPLESYEKYARTVNREFIWNTMSFGDDVLPEEERNALDEHNGQTTWAFPHPTGTGLRQFSPAITGGYLIERTRRLQRNIASSDSSQHDERLFLIQGLGDTNQAEAAERFDSVSGIFAPDTAYNLIHSPQRRARRWQVVTGAAVYGQPDGAVIRHTSTRGNAGLTTRLAADQGCLGGDPARELMTEGDDLVNNALRNPGPIFKPFTLEFTCDITPDLYEVFEQAHNGQLVAIANGYIPIIDPEGVLRKGAIIDAPRVEESNKVTFTLIELAL